MFASSVRKLITRPQYTPAGGRALSTFQASGQRRGDGLKRLFDAPAAVSSDEHDSGGGGGAKAAKRDTHGDEALSSSGPAGGFSFGFGF